jgi:hypothetical protein
MKKFNHPSGFESSKEFNGAEQFRDFEQQFKTHEDFNPETFTAPPAFPVFRFKRFVRRIFIPAATAGVGFIGGYFVASSDEEPSQFPAEKVVLEAALSLNVVHDAHHAPVSIDLVLMPELVRVHGARAHAIALVPSTNDDVSVVHIHHGNNEIHEMANDGDWVVGGVPVEAPRA